jgi:hypothetical protein
MTKATRTTAYALSWLAGSTGLRQYAPNHRTSTGSTMRGNVKDAKRRRDYLLILGAAVFSLGVLIVAGIVYTYAGGHKPAEDKDIRARLDISAAHKRQALP